MTQRTIRLRVNGQSYESQVEARLLLSDFLRDHLGLTGTHVGCEHGVCGACTVLMNGTTVRSCLTFAIQAGGAEIRTVEGMAEGAVLHPLQQAFHETHALQCGFCSPGFLIALEAFLAEHPNPTDAEIRDAVSGNLCRCTGYQNIEEAVRVVVAGRVKEAT